VVGVDTLQEGEEAVLERVLHEAAHVLCWTRGIKDTTMRGAYHNASYLTAAEEVGLIWPDNTERVQGRGYVSPQLTDAARHRYADDLAALKTAIPQVLPHLVVPDAPRSKRPDRLALQCSCKPKPRTIRVSQTVAALGAITCAVCGQDFE
jgi:predicted SprT family Zn-dependent metalloprotease